MYRNAMRGASGAPARLRVLVVDDSPSIGVLARVVLAGINAEVDFVETGTAALGRLAVGGPYDAALIDLRLKDMACADLVRLITQRRPKVAIVVATGRTRTAAFHCDTWLQKPYLPKDLVAAIREAIVLHRVHARVTERGDGGAGRDAFEAVRTSGLHQGGQRCVVRGSAAASRDAGRANVPAGREA